MQDHDGTTILSFSNFSFMLASTASPELIFSTSNNYVTDETVLDKIKNSRGSALQECHDTIGGKKCPDGHF